MEATTAAVYLRKSSVDQRAGENRSLVDQRHDLEQLAERHGLQIVARYEEVEGTSASAFKDHDRPQYDRALAEMGSTYEVLLSRRTDRMVRAGGRTSLRNLQETPLSGCPNSARPPIRGPVFKPR